MSELAENLRQEFLDKDYADAYTEEFLNLYIATQIKVLREQRNMTQAQLAELSGMKQERICVLENANYESWSIKTLRKVARAFDVTLRVSFETFSHTIAEIEKFNRMTLERAPRGVDLSKPILSPVRRTNVTELQLLGREKSMQAAEVSAFAAAYTSIHKPKHEIREHSAESASRLSMEHPQSQHNQYPGSMVMR